MDRIRSADDAKAPSDLVVSRRKADVWQTIRDNPCAKARIVAANRRFDRQPIALVSTSDDFRSTPPHMEITKKTSH
jgi:hypothetical protein